MSNRSDLTPRFDNRFLTFRENFTTKQHLLSFHDDLTALGRLTGAGFQETLRSHESQSIQTERLHGAVARHAAESLGQQREMGHLLREAVGGIDRVADGVGRVEEAQWQTVGAVQENTSVTRRGFDGVNRRLEDVYWAVGTSAELNARGQREIAQELRGGFGLLSGQLGGIAHGITDMRGVLEQISNTSDDLLWTVEEGFVAMVEGQQEIACILENGFESLAYEFHWGLARIAHQLELNREVFWLAVQKLDQILHTLRNPRQTQANEYRRQAEDNIRNGLWDEAVRYLRLSLKEWDQDYLSHYHLARTLWFQRGEWEIPLEHFRLAARYAGTPSADRHQLYFAAMACIHGSLLWRMDADTYPEKAIESNRMAYNASERAMSLRPDLLMVRVEHVANCMRVGEVKEAFAIIDSEAAKAPSNLDAYLINLDLKAFPQVALYIHRHKNRIRWASEQAEIGRLNEERRRQVEQRRAEEERRERAEAEARARAEEERAAAEARRLHEEAAARDQAEAARQVEEERQRRIADGPRLAAMEESALRLTHLYTRLETNTWRADVSNYLIVFHPVRNDVLVVKNGVSTFLWKLDQYWRPSREAKKLIDGANFCVFSPGGSEIVAVTGSSIGCFDSESGMILHTLIDSNTGIRAIDISPDERRMVTIGSSVTLWNWQHRVPTRDIPLNAIGVTAVRYSRDGSKLVFLRLDSVSIYDSSTYEELRTVALPGNLIEGIFSRELSYILCAHSSTELSLVSGEHVLWSTSWRSPITAVALSEINQVAITGHSDGWLVIWDLKTGQMLRMLMEHGPVTAITNISISPDHRIVAVGETADKKPSDSRWDNALNSYSPITSRIHVWSWPR